MTIDADVFDKAVIDRKIGKCMVQLNLNQPPYQVTHMWKVYSDRIEEIVNVPSEENYTHLLSVRNKFEHSMYRLDKQDELENLKMIKNIKRITYPRKKKIL